MVLVDQCILDILSCWEQCTDEQVQQVKAYFIPDNEDWEDIKLKVWKRSCIDKKGIPYISQYEIEIWKDASLICEVDVNPERKKGYYKFFEFS